MENIQSRHDLMIKGEGVKRAHSYWRSGFSCAEVVLASYCEQFGLDSNLGIKISNVFIGGTAQDGRMCGAVTAALMVFGLKYGRTRVEEGLPENRKAIALSKELMERFKARNQGNIYCKDLLGFDVSTPKGMRERNSRIRNNTLPCCWKYIKDALEILDDFL
jgi:C_GCAxxG_C_C family probable redox protein